MSGGVDSAVAAARAVEAGHDVVGVHLALSRKPASAREGARGCCTLDDARDARRAADVLGIPFYVWDLAERFREDVIEDFVAEYAAGAPPTRACAATSGSSSRPCSTGRSRSASTPSSPATTPGSTPDRRRCCGAASTRRRTSPTCSARSARTSSPHAMFPLGGSTKAEVRAEAAARGLAVADKPDSTDICFIASGDTSGWLHDRLGAQPGPVLDTAGRSSAATTGPTRSRSGSARACVSTGPPRTAAPATSSASRRSTGPSPSARPRRSTSGARGAESTYAGPPSTAGRRSGRTGRPCRPWPRRRRPAARPARRAGPGHGAGSGRRPLRRDPDDPAAGERVLGGGRVVSAA